MSTIQATIRDTKTKGQVNDLRNNGNVPGIIYGGEEPNQKITISFVLDPLYRERISNHVYKH